MSDKATGIKSSSNGDSYTWEQMNEYFVNLTSDNKTEMMQQLNLLSFVQYLGNVNIPGVELTMYNDKPDVVTFDIVRRINNDRFFVSNVSFVIDGSVLFTISDFQKRRWAGFFNRVFLLPRFKKNFFYYAFKPAQVTHQVLENFVKTVTEVGNGSEETLKIEAYTSALFGMKPVRV